MILYQLAVIRTYLTAKILPSGRVPGCAVVRAPQATRNAARGQKIAAFAHLWKWWGENRLGGAFRRLPDAPNIDLGHRAQGTSIGRAFPRGCFSSIKWVFINARWYQGLGPYIINLWD